MKRWDVNCVECGKKDSFNDFYAIREANWKVLAWIVPDGGPRVVCNECEYGRPKKKTKGK